MNYAARNYLFSFFLLYFHIAVQAQFSFQANAETGLYNSKGNFLLKKSGLFTGLEGKAAYKYQHEKNNASIQLKARPEFYGSESNLTSFKFRAAGDYSRKEENYNWGINLTSDLNNILSDVIDIYYKTFLLQGNLTLFIIENFPLSVNCGYAHQKINSSSEQNLDLFLGEVKIHQGFSSYFKAAYGLYAENFSIKNNVSPSIMNQINLNSGFRAGPSIEINYLKDFLFNFQYRFLFHSSDQTKFPSYEQWVRMVAGKLVFDNFSVFLLVDYYFRKFNNASAFSATLPALYTPLNRENRLSFKAGYDISEQLEIYAKSQYFSENLIYNDYLIEGWSLVIGMQFTN